MKRKKLFTIHWCSYNAEAYDAMTEKPICAKTLDEYKEFLKSDTINCKSVGTIEVYNDGLDESMQKLVSMESCANDMFKCWFEY